MTDARRYQVEPAWSAVSFDQQYYRGLLDKAWEEIEFAFREVRKTPGGEKNCRAIPVRGGMESWQSTTRTVPQTLQSGEMR